VRRFAVSPVSREFPLDRLHRVVWAADGVRLNASRCWFSDDLWVANAGVSYDVILGLRSMKNTPFHLSRYGLREQPFAPTADPAYFYATKEHKSCLYRLWNSIDERHGIAVVLGNYGTGKTTLLRKLLTGMAADPEKYNTAVIASPIPSWTSFALLEAIIKQFKLHPEERSFTSYMEALNHYLMASRGRVTTLIIDDAQNLNKRGQLELLRLAQNLETQQHKLLNLVLFAQLEWARVLDAAPNFKQRVNLTYTLEQLSRDDVKQFIRFRLAQAGLNAANAAPFDDAAITLIHSYSQGNPRLVVTLCRNALFFAAQVKAKTVSREIVVHTIEKTTGTTPIQRTTTARTSPTVPNSTTVYRLGDTATRGVTAASRKASDSAQRANRLLLKSARSGNE
jgi:type II secretory pathway predicted ATPase ExeA